MNSVTEELNIAHLNNYSSIGQPDGVEVHGWPLVPSINLSTAYAFDTIDDLGLYHQNKYESVRYSRDSSVLVRQLEGYFSILHGGRHALLFNSGMAAIGACLNTLLQKDSTIRTIGSFYRKSESLFSDARKRFGVPYKSYGSEDELIADSGDGDKSIILVESPSNPFLRLCDVPRIRKELPAAAIIYDTTFQGLLNGQELFEYADLIVMSCTKVYWWP
jgi:cystathionine beta-lyase/cystathionine gamma-synthase